MGRGRDEIHSTALEQYLLIHDEVLLAVRGDTAALVAQSIVLESDSLSDTALEPLALPAAGKPTRPCGQRDNAGQGIRQGIRGGRRWLATGWVAFSSFSTTQFADSHWTGFSDGFIASPHVRTRREFTDLGDY